MDFSHLCGWIWSESNEWTWSRMMNSKSLMLWKIGILCFSSHQQMLQFFFRKLSAEAAQVISTKLKSFQRIFCSDQFHNEFCTSKILFFWVEHIFSLLTAFQCRKDLRLFEEKVETVINNISNVLLFLCSQKFCFLLQNRCGASTEHTSRRKHKTVNSQRIVG